MTNDTDYSSHLDDLGIDYKVKGSELLADCPYCFHHKPKLSINSESGLFQCLVCGETGKFPKLIHKLKELPGPVRSAPVLAGHRSPKYLIPKDTEVLEIGKLDWKSEESLNYLQSRGISVWPSIGTHNDKVVYPFLGPTTGETVALKYKSLDRSSNPFMEGQHPGLYIPYFSQFTSAKSLIIVEGEEDSLAAIQLAQGLAGITAIATTGATNHKCVQHIGHFSQTYIWLDNDEAGLKQTSVLAAKLKDAWPDMVIRILKPIVGVKDPNDYLLMGYSSEEFLRHLESSSYYHNKPLSRAASSYVAEMYTYLGDKTKAQGFPTLMPGLDKLLGGGRRLGEVTALQALAKSGKNTLWHQLQYNWLQAGIPIGYASRELSPETEVLPNLLSIHFEKNMWKQSAEVSQAAIQEVVSQWPLYFADGYGVFEIGEFRSWVRELKKKGVNHFFADHFHYMLSDSENPKEVSRFARELKSLAKEENIHLDIIIQPSHIDEGRKMGLRTLRGGAAIGQAIDNLLILERAQVVGEENISKLTLEVARHKLARPGKTLYLKYYPETTRMEEITLEDNLAEITPTQPKKDWSIK